MTDNKFVLDGDDLEQRNVPLQVSSEADYLDTEVVKSEIEKCGYIFDDVWINYFLKLKIRHYELQKLKLSDLYIDDWQNENMGTPVKIKDSPNYKYLCGNKSEYITRCQNEPSHSCEKFDELIKKLNQEGANPSNIICVDENNHIIDGAHRASWLAYKYGEDCIITVLKIYLDKK